jgi:hypothetical protein
MADKKKKGMTKEQLLKDADLEVDLPKRYSRPEAADLPKDRYQGLLGAILFGIS